MPKTAYHHGDLRQALVDAALDVMMRDGLPDFTLARAAKAAGVTPAAVYRHFTDRRDLLAEVARQGHERLAFLTSHAENTADPATAILDYAGAFSDFVRSFPGHFCAMSPGIVPTDQTALLADAVARSDAILMRLCVRLGEASGAELPPEDIARHIQVLCRGLVQSPCDTQGDTLRSALAVYLRGLGLSPPIR
ncbi:MAG: TetR/AcrR family transcriptional regulator [Pseudomonadota bacterium]